MHTATITFLNNLTQKERQTLLLRGALAFGFKSAVAFETELRKDSSDEILEALMQLKSCDDTMDKSMAMHSMPVRFELLPGDGLPVPNQELFVNCDGQNKTANY